MADVIDFNLSSLQLLFSQEEYELFRTIVQEVCTNFPDVKGALLTGSLTQKINLPEPPPEKNELTDLAKAYASIVGRTRRKLFPHIDSDLDLWILTEEQEGNEGIAKKLDERALDLLKWYADQSESVDLVEWIHLKRQAFDEFYKQRFLYSPQWLASNQVPAHAVGLKYALEQRIGAALPKVKRKIDYYFRKTFPGEFIEARSFPPSVFNLKTERIPVMDYEDRTPFPFYIKDWIDLGRNCLILYTSGNMSSLIYPFNPEGIILGQNIAHAIGWTPRHIDFVLYHEGRRGHDHRTSF